MRPYRQGKEHAQRSLGGETEAASPAQSRPGACRGDSESHLVAEDLRLLVGGRHGARGGGGQQATQARPAAGSGECGAQHAVLSRAEISGVELSRAVPSRTERSLDQSGRVQRCKPTSSPRPRRPPIGGGNTRAGRESLSTPNDLRGATQALQAKSEMESCRTRERPEKALPAPKVVPGFHECGYSVDNLGLGTGGAGWHWPGRDADAWPHSCGLQPDEGSSRLRRG